MYYVGGFVRSIDVAKLPVTFPEKKNTYLGPVSRAMRQEIWYKGNKSKKNGKLAFLFE